jgi:virginiamycin B lyase
MSMTFTPIPLDQTTQSAGLIIAGPDNAIWFEERQHGSIGRLDPANVAHPQEIALPGSLVNVIGLTVGPDNMIWFIDQEHNVLGKIDPVSHAVSEYVEPPAVTKPGDLGVGIVAGPDSNLWVIKQLPGRIQRIDPAAIFNLAEFEVDPGAASILRTTPYGITSGADGNLWFSFIELDANGKVPDRIPESIHRCQDLPGRHPHRLAGWFCASIEQFV